MSIVAVVVALYLSDRTAHRMAKHLMYRHDQLGQRCGMKEEKGGGPNNQAPSPNYISCTVYAGTRLAPILILSAHEKVSVSAVILARTPIRSRSRPAQQASAASVPRRSRPRLERLRSAWAGSCSDCLSLIDTVHVWPLILLRF